MAHSAFVDPLSGSYNSALVAIMSILQCFL